MKLYGLYYKNEIVCVSENRDLIILYAHNKEFNNSELSLKKLKKSDYFIYEELRLVTAHKYVMTVDDTAILNMLIDESDTIYSDGIKFLASLLQTVGGGDKKHINRVLEIAEENKHNYSGKKSIEETVSIVYALSVDDKENLLKIVKGNMK